MCSFAPSSDLNGLPHPLHAGDVVSNNFRSLEGHEESGDRLFGEGARSRRACSAPPLPSWVPSRPQAGTLRATAPKAGAHLWRARWTGSPTPAGPAPSNQAFGPRLERLNRGDYGRLPSSPNGVERCSDQLGFFLYLAKFGPPRGERRRIGCSGHSKKCNKTVGKKSSPVGFKLAKEAGIDGHA